jgi:L-2-hydroxyglutarate oxidase
VAIVGGGIVGVATAHAMLGIPDLRIVVLEAEEKLASHQTGRNSGVIHSGLYYKPGSLKAQLCASGRQAMYDFCAAENISHEHCGKIVVATQESEMPALLALEERGRANGLSGIRRLTPAETREMEPHIRGCAALHVPETGIVDYAQVVAALAGRVRNAGHQVATRMRLIAVEHDAHCIALHTSQDTVRARCLINCAGLQSDRVARLCGVDPGLRIVPFRGEYYLIKPERRSLVRGLVYPVPDPRYPFLGVHFTRRITGEMEAGPNAVLALKREGYTRTSASARDIWGIASYRGFWAMAAKHWRMGLGEMHRSWSKSAFVGALRRLLPEIQAGDLTPGGAGVRAQAVLPDGSLVDDFRIVERDRMVHVLNAPSPAATASLSIGRYIADRALPHLR